MRPWVFPMTVTSPYRTQSAGSGSSRIRYAILCAMNFVFKVNLLLLIPTSRVFDLELAAFEDVCKNAI
jgi:hypothetical protein